MQRDPLWVLLTPRTDDRLWPYRTKEKKSETREGMGMDWVFLEDAPTKVSDEAIVLHIQKWINRNIRNYSYCV